MRDVELVPDTITARLTALQARVADVVKRADDEILKAELQEFGRRIRDARDGISIFLEQSAPEHVYWVERTGRTERFLALNAAPIDLAPVLRRMLFRDNCCCVMTSATLAVGRPDLAYFRTRIGAMEAEPLQLGSPFNFQKQMKMFVVQKCPIPATVVITKPSNIGSRISCRRVTVARLSFSRAIATCSRSQVRWKIFCERRI